MVFSYLIEMKTLIILLLLLASIGSKAQTWDEFFRQKATQKKYLLQQIAALKVYADYLSKGYKIADKGLKTIKGFTKGEFELHSDFFSSLKTVNPVIGDSKKIKEIFSWQVAILKDYNSINKILTSSDNDREYFKSVREKVLKECEQDIEELMLVISSGKLEMKDDERIKRIDKLYERMKEKYQFTKAFSSKVKVLNLQREQEDRNIKAAEKLYQTTN